MTVNENTCKKSAGLVSHKKEARPQKESKNYDNEINRLNERIKLAEEEKRRLNIQFNPFSKTPGKEKRTSINESIETKLNGRYIRSNHDQH